MFTIAGRPAANVSKSLFGEFVASTGTSLKSVRQALDSDASRRHVALAAAAEARRSAAPSAPARRRRLPSPMSTKLTSGSRLAASTAAVQVVRLSHRPEVGDLERPLGRRGVEEVEVGRVRHEHRPPGGKRGLDPGRQRDQPRAPRVRQALERPGEPARERVAERAHLDRRLRPQVAHLEHERGAPAERRRERRQRHRERRRGRIDHVRPRAAQRGPGRPRARSGRRPPCGRRSTSTSRACSPRTRRARPRPRCRPGFGCPRLRLPSAPRGPAPRSGARTRTSACRPRHRGSRRTDAGRGCARAPNGNQR